jgi:hypothetical protein
MQGDTALVSTLSAEIHCAKVTAMKLKLNCFCKTLGALLMALVVSTARASEPTALELIKEGNRHVGEDSKDKVTQIRSEKSVGGLVPNIWYVVYYDPDARMKATEVKFGSGKKLDVIRPFRLLERANAFTAMDRTKLKIDSDEALKLAQKDGLLERVKLTNSKLTLEKGEEGVPVWKVQFWAEKARDTTRTVDIGQVVLGAEDGKILRRDLHIERID